MSQHVKAYRIRATTIVRESDLERVRRAVEAAMRHHCEVERELVWMKELDGCLVACFCPECGDDRIMTACDCDECADGA